MYRKGKRLPRKRRKYQFTDIIIIEDEEEAEEEEKEEKEEEKKEEEEDEEEQDLQRKRKGKKKQKEKEKEKKVPKRVGASMCKRSGGHVVVDEEWWSDLIHKISSPSFSRFNSIVDENNKFKSIFRVSRSTFDYICSLVRPDLTSTRKSGEQGKSGNEPRGFSVEKQVAVSLRRLASGDSQSFLGRLFNIGQSTVPQIMWRFVESMEGRGKSVLQWAHKEEEMEKVKEGFHKQGGLPNCCGVIDLTHVLVTHPGSEFPEDWIDREGNYSMTLQVIVDAEMKFRDIVTGWPGGMNEANVLEVSQFYNLCQKGDLLKGSGTSRDYIVGERSYPLLPWLITPFPKEEEGRQVCFNMRHAAVMGIAKRALARLKGTWRILDQTILRPDRHKLPCIILVCCMLHNIMIDRGDMPMDDLDIPEDHDSPYPPHIFPCIDDHNDDNELGSALALRDSLADLVCETQ